MINSSQKKKKKHKIPDKAFRVGMTSIILVPGEEIESCFDTEHQPEEVASNKKYST